MPKRAVVSAKVSLRRIVVLTASWFATGCMGVQACAADTIKIGAIYATSGPAAFLGVPEERGLRLTADELNQHGGIAGRKIVVTVYDTEGNGTKASQLLRRLIDSD